MTDPALKTAFGFHQAGDLTKAAALYGDILREHPRNFDALYLLGFVHFQRGGYDEAEALMAQALTLQPRSLDALRNRGLALVQLRRAGEALASFDLAIVIAPGIADLHAARARVLSALERHREAIGSYDAALALAPQAGDIWNNRGNAALALHRAEEALANFDRALTLLPNNPLILNNRGNALAELGRYEDAVESYTRAAMGAPDDPGILNHRAIAAFEAKRYAAAAEDFAAVLGLDPAHEYARGNLVYAQLQICDWRGLEKEKADIRRRLAEGERVITPIQHTAVFDSPQQQLEASRIWAADKYPSTAAPLWRGERYRHDRIRIAYLSADFHAHATAALMAGVFEHHDRSRFETHAVSFGRDDRSPMRRRLLPAFERFHDVRGLSDGESAQSIRRHEIDIALDLKGYTQESRPGILAHRAAPVQAQYLGFPGTMGAGFIDYILADRVVVPPEQENFYSEKVVMLPGSYQCNDDKRVIAARTPTRGELGLPEKGFVFCCFNNNYKIMPDVFAIWMRLLKAVDGSVLWLIEDSRAAADNLRRAAEEAGVTPSRLVFAPRINLEEHLARHRLADLFLDTLPYGAHTTASDALYAGLPVLTCQGKGFAGRVSASLLTAAALTELLTHSFPEYEALALKLARDPATLAAIKRKLADNRGTMPPFDTVRFTRTLEIAYTLMWQRAERGDPPTAFTVAKQQ